MFALVQGGIDGGSVVLFRVGQMELTNWNGVSRRRPRSPGDALGSVRVEAWNEHKIVSALVDEEIRLFSNNRRFGNDGVGSFRPGSRRRIHCAHKYHVPGAALPAVPFGVAGKPLLLR